MQQNDASHGYISNIVQLLLINYCFTFKYSKT